MSRYRPAPRPTFRPAVERLEDRLAPAVLPGFTETLVAGGLNSPTAMEFAPDGRLFVAEQGGTLRVVANGALLPTPFLTLNVDATGERGLLGVAFDPNFAADHFVYVYYTVPGSPAHNRVSRFTAAGDTAAPGSEFVLMDLDNLGATNHNGGAIHFGPDGKLYVAVGENAVPANAQTLSNRLGKMLRINADGSIPTDNPFYNQASGANRAIWALGLRNPFTFAFEPKTGRLFINDVGQSAWEEIDDGVAGANYGWPTHEGVANPPDPNDRDPIYAYFHDGIICAITGGTFYDPVKSLFPANYVGDYFFSDLCGGWIKTFDPATGAVSTLATGIDGPVDLKVSGDGALYYLAHNSGQVYRIQYVGSGPVDGGSSLGVFDPATANWYIKNANSPGAPDVGPFAYGGPNWIPVAGDWNGDGRTTLGVVDPSTMTWYLKNNNSPGAPDIAPFRYGAPGWIPVVGDWDGNGTTTIGVVDPATMTWYLKNSNSQGAPDIAPFRYGAPGWVPVVGDWDGNGTTTIGVFDPATATWYVKNANTQGAPDVAPFRYGGAGWVPVAGDWDGNGTDTIGVFDPSTASWYLKNTIAPGAPDVGPFPYGGPGWMPVPAKWNPRAAERAAGGAVPDAGAAPLTQPALDAIVAAVLSQPGGASLAGLASVEFRVGDLGSDELAVALLDQRVVVIDDNAAGHGWFVDPTPSQDEEFLGGPGGTLTARPGGPADGRMDLLTVVRHELGHFAGLKDLDGAADALMSGTLAAGERRL